MSTRQPTLFEVDDREGASDVTHVLMPNMAYACGGSILTKAGHFTVGPHLWGAFTCPGCRQQGHDALASECREQQGRQADVA